MAPNPFPWSDSDTLWMQRALAEAHRGLGHVEPNPLVGAVVARGHDFISAGYHARFGAPHAEVNALNLAREAARGASLYVTLEPCCHQGKTPPCVQAIIQAGIKRVVAAMRDPFPQVDGGGLRQLADAGITVECGLLEPHARRLNAPYLKRLATGRPYVTAKWAMTLDGKLASRTGNSRWISNERARALVHQLRGRMDAIVVGVGTALADDPRLTARPPGPRVATRVVLDPSARLGTDSHLARTAREIPVIVATRGATPPAIQPLKDAGCELLDFPTVEPSLPIARLLENFGARGWTNILLEGGGKTLGHFFDAQEIDALEVFIAPRILGGEHAICPVEGLGLATIAESPSLEIVSLTQLGDNIHLSALLPKPWNCPSLAPGKP